MVCHALLDSPTRGPVCGGCWADLLPFSPPLCRRCGDPLASWRAASLQSGLCARCRRLPSAIDAGRAWGGYDGALRAILHAFKYHHCPGLASPLAARLAEVAADLLDGADMAVAVPLHWRRRLSRGFNQAALVARRLGLPVRRPLRRARHTAPQVSLTAAGRRQNVRGAFRLARWPWTRRQVEGRTIVLVDDVSTTGATLEECARLLKAAGARQVRTVTVARALARPR